MPFHIIPRRDLSLAQLLDLHRAGQYVIKTPHVGNVYPNNLAMAALGIPLLLVDQTIGVRDTNFHPHCVIVGGQAEAVADPYKLTSHSRIQRASALVPKRFVPGESLARTHVQAAREVFPRAPIETTSERAREHEASMMALLAGMTELDPYAWRRRVDADGTVQAVSSPRGWQEVERAGIHGLSSDGSGWIVPNAWNIMSDGVIGTRLSGSATIYSLSGPDMIRYCRGKLVTNISRWYDALRTRHIPEWPATITMVMVPVAEMRLVTVGSRASEMNDLVKVYCECLDLNHAIGEQVKDLSGEVRKVVLAELFKQRTQVWARLCEAARACPEVFYDIHQANCLSQYDLLNGQSLYVHPWGVHSSVQMVIDMMALLRQLLESE